MGYFTKITINCSTDPILSSTEERSFWLRWSPHEVSLGRGLTVGDQLMASKSHPDPQGDVYKMSIQNSYGWANVTIHVDLVIHILTMWEIECCYHHIPNMKIVENLSLVVLDCTFTMYWPRVYSISQWWNLCEKERASPPGQFIALKAINALKGTISG